MWPMETALCKGVQCRNGSWMLTSAPPWKSNRTFSTLFWCQYGRTRKILSPPNDGRPQDSCSMDGWKKRSERVTHYLLCSPIKGRDTLGLRRHVGIRFLGQEKADYSRIRTVPHPQGVQGGKATKRRRKSRLAKKKKRKIVTGTNR